MKELFQIYKMTAEDAEKILTSPEEPHIHLCTIGIWGKGIMIEEHLFWDNQTYMNQIGLGK